MKKIVLLGYMGSGKSTIAKILSKKIHYDYKDLDQVIEKAMGLTINEIFEQKGEVFFRKLEHQFLTELLASNENMIIGLGGGTPCFSNNNALLLADHISSIYLKTSIDKLFNRLRHSLNRPLVANKSDEELKEFIAKSLFERSYYYNQANYTVVTDDKAPDLIANEIKSLLI